MPPPFDHLKRIAVTAALIAIGITVTAPARAADHPRCNAAVYHQFDFWLGNWDVFDPAGVLQGYDNVTRETSGCIIHEHWMSAPDDQTGQSLSGYDRRTKQWTHAWQDSYGGQLYLGEGHATRNVMRMTGHHPTAAGANARERVTWTAEGFQVRQVWDFSTDGGRTWKKHFEGLFRRHKS